MSIDWTAVATEVVKAVVAHWIPALGAFLVGGAGGTSLGRSLRRPPLKNSDFRIVNEETNVTISGDLPDTTKIAVIVHRIYSLKLIERKRSGIFELGIQLGSSAIEGKWIPGDCNLKVNDVTPIGLEFSEQDKKINSKKVRVNSTDELAVELKSIERMSVNRGFYALIVSNPKSDTSFTWQRREFDRPVEARASSDDFDIQILSPGVKEKINKSDHQVTYFFTWPKG